MKKVLIGLLAVIVLAIGAFVVVASLQPGEVHVERSVTIAATPADVFPHVHDLRKFVEWSPWSDVDPNQTVEFSDPSTGVGAWYSWDGNEDVGVGKMQITAVEQDAKVVQDLTFLEPWESDAEVSFLLAAAGDGTEVTWTFDDQADFMMKVMSLFMDMDDMLGPDYEKGLRQLDAQVTAAVAERLAAEEAARVVATAEGAEGEGGEGDAEPVVDKD